jgi:hypothetical protein
LAICRYNRLSKQFSLLFKFSHFHILLLSFPSILSFQKILLLLKKLRSLGFTDSICDWPGSLNQWFECTFLT